MAHRLLAYCLFALLLALLAAIPARADAPGRVTVFAAASLKEGLEQVAADFRAATGHRVVISLAGSSALARQIQAGAPADLFISANPQWMDVLAGDGLLVPGTRFDLAANRLVLIAPEAPDSATESATDPGPLPLTEAALAARLGNGRLAVALTDAVPAGIYARQALMRLGLWDGLAPRLAQTDNVRAALALVALGEAPLGIVYATDAAAEPRVRVLVRIPPDGHAPIRYPAARIAGRGGPAAEAFLAWLQSDKARAALARHGFAPPGGAKE